MYAAVLEQPGSIVLAEHPEPSAPGPGEALVAVRRVGICGTDHHAFGGRQNFFAYPRVLGHELAVEVLAVGPGVDRVAVGDECAVLPYLSCGGCISCRRQRANCCERITVLGVTADGGLRERMVVPAAHLFTAPGLSLDQLVLVETLGIGWHAVARARPEAHDRALVLGAGPVGLAVAQAARRRADRVVLADTSAARVAFAVSCGLEAMLVDEGFVERLHDSVGSPPTVVFDATGNRTSMESAFGLAAPTGTVVFVGHTTGTITFANPTFHARELDVRGSRNATVVDWRGVIDGVLDGSLDALPWINHRTTLAGIVDDLPRLASASGPVIKTIVELDGSGTP